MSEFNINEIVNALRAENRGIRERKQVEDNENLVKSIKVSNVPDYITEDEIPDLVEVPRGLGGPFFDTSPGVKITLGDYKLKENEFKTNSDNYCSNCNINCFTQLR